MYWVSLALGTGRGVRIPEIVWWASANIGLKMEFKVKLNQTSYSSPLELVSEYNSTGDSISIVSSNQIRMGSKTYTFPGLDLFDAEAHSISIEKINSTQTSVTVDELATQVDVVGNLNLSYSNLFGWSQSIAGSTSLDGALWDFQSTRASGEVTHNLPIDDGPSSTTIVNKGTGVDGIITGTEGVDYVWV
tara:strand:- start:42093 stop:42662 length:570 start_codon:yes stop_codon:yes gene_type:complete